MSPPGAGRTGRDTIWPCSGKPGYDGRMEPGRTPPAAGGSTARAALGATGLALGLIGLFATPAQAYLDPGTGSYVFQMVAAALVSGAFLLKAYWHKLLRLLGRREREDPPPPPDGR